MQSATWPPVKRNDAPLIHTDVEGSQDVGPGPRLSLRRNAACFRHLVADRQQPARRLARSVPENTVDYRPLLRAALVPLATHKLDRLIDQASAQVRFPNSATERAIVPSSETPSVSAG